MASEVTRLAHMLLSYMDKCDLQLTIEPKVLSLLTRVSNFFTQQGIKSYLVGGFVRDTILKRATADIDIAITADTLDIAPRLALAISGKHILLDKTNKVSRIVLTGEDASLSGERQHLDLSSLTGSLEQDLAHRDFTINAMAIELEQFINRFQHQTFSISKRGGNQAPPKPSILTDPFNGWHDLNQGTIRTVSNTAFESDPARLLRAVRLGADLNFSLDEKTESLIQHNCHLIVSIAGERIREELLRLLAIPKSGRLFPYLDKLGLVIAVFPELEQAKEATQPKEHFRDVFGHSLKTVEAVDFLLRQGSWTHANNKILTVVPWSTMIAQHFTHEISHGSTRASLLKLAALLHDIAKPQTKTIEEDGRIRFLGHAKEGAIMTANILERLRFSSKEIRVVETVVRHHLRPGQMSHDELPSRRAIYRYFRDTGETGIDTLFLSLADHLATRGPQLDIDQWQEHAKIVDYVLTQRFQEKAVVIPPKLVDGHDLVNIFGIKPGPQIGQLLEIIREAQASGELVSREEVLSFIRDRLLTKAR